MTNCAMATNGNEGPVWLSCFLKGKYFSSCKLHVSDRNHFCIECISGPLCPVGLQHEHSHHRTLQVRRASHFDAVRVADIQKLVDITQIQTYVINGAKIVFLLSRPQQKMAKEAAKACKSCGRSLADPVSYCSIGCKLIGVRENLSNEEVSLTLERDNTHYISVMRKQAAMSATPPGSCCEDWPSLSPVIKSFEDILDNAPMKKPRKLVFDDRGVDRRRNFDEMPLRHSSESHDLQQHAGCYDSPPAPSTPQSRESGSLRGKHKRKWTPHRAPLA